MAPKFNFQAAIRRDLSTTTAESELQMTLNQQDSASQTEIQTGPVETDAVKNDSVNEIQGPSESVANDLLMRLLLRLLLRLVMRCLRRHLMTS